MFSVRIVDADFYVTKPTARLDVFYSEFREANVTRVPVIRIFGSTPSGQKTCLHVHQVFPYIFVPYDGTQPREKYLKQFATSVDFAIQVALGKATSTTNHVYKTEIVRRIPFYGYHKDEQEFIKIQFYNPRMVAKVVDLLQNGAILNKIFQPYESHIPYLLQFLIDFNLYGMNLLHARKVLFRGSSGIEKKNSRSQTSSSYVSSCNPNDSSSFHTSATSWQYWTENTIPSDLCLATDIAKTSRCELEVDVIAEDILNQLEIGTSIGRNPGIAAMWEDEKQRRRDHGQPSQISIPISQDRGEMKLLNSEREFKGRIREIIQERIQMIQSQLEIMEKSLSPEEFQEFSQSILLDGKEPYSQCMISQDVDENIPVVDESVIEDVLQASQSQPSSLSGQIDEELVAILLSLADDPNDSEPQECSPTANTSQMIVSEKTESDDEEEESLIMSQPVWNDDDQIEDCESGSQSAEDDDEEDWKPQRIPQLDGPADDDEPSLSNQSTTARTSKKKKMGGNKEMKSDDDDDFRIKKKPKISGNHKNISRTKRELPRRPRKTAIAQLNVLGGNSKHQNRHESCTILSEPATNTHRYRPPVGSEIANWNEGKFPNLELFHQSSKQRTTDKECLGTGEVGKIRSLVKHKNEDHDKNKGNSHGPNSKNEDMTNIKSRTSKKMKYNLLHLETESSGSQTSDFELRLSDSSSDGEDFKCKKKVSKITAGDLKHESFHVAKQSPVKSRLSKEDNSKYKKCKTINTELLDKDAKLCSLKSTIISQNRKSSSSNQTRISKKSYSSSLEHGCEIGAPTTSPLKSGNSSAKHSSKDTEKSRNDLESRKRKRTRSKKATCLMFTHVDNQNKADKLNLSKTGTSRKSDKCSFAKTDYDKPEMRSKLSITSHDLTSGIKECPRNERNNIEDKKENECSIHRNSRNSKEIKNENNISKDVEKENQVSVSRNSGNREVKNESKFRENRIMLDACIRLEKISVKELKSKNNKANVLEYSPQDVKDIVSLAVEMNDDTRNSKDFVIDDKLDSLYQMATLSPRSVTSDVHSPPLPSSPSLNSHEQSLDNSLFPGKGDGLDKEINMSKGYSKKHFNSLVPSLSDKDKQNADTKFTYNQITLDNDVDADVFSMKPTTVDFPIKFVSEEEVKNIACQSVSASKEHIGKEFTACANSFNDSLSPGISASSNGDEAGSCMDIREREVEICRDMDIMSPGISAVCDSFSSEEQPGLDIQEILKDIESPGVFGGQESSGETNIDMNRVVKDDESPYVSKDQNLPRETYSESHHDSQKTDHTKTTTTLHEVDVEDDLVVTFSDKLDTLDTDGSMDKCHSMPQTTTHSHHDSEKNNHTKMTTSLHKVDDEDDLVVTFSDKLDTLDKDGSTDKCHSMPQTTIESHHDSEKDDHSKIWRPATEAPSPSYVLETRRLYGLPHERHQKAFCSDPKDIPSVSRVIGGRRLQVSSLSVDELPEFDLGGSFQTLHEFRRQTGDHMDNSLLRDCLRSLDIQSGNDGYIGVPRELKLALMGDHQVIITPVILPPSPKDVRKWMKERRSGNQLTSQSQEPEVVGNYISQGLEKNTFPDEAELSNIPRGENSEKSPKDDNTEILVSRESSVVTHSPKLADRTLDLREISQPTQGVSQSISRDVLFGPQHSTPVGNPRMKSRKFWQCTPVEGDEAKLLQQDLESKISSEEKSCKIKSLRRNILNSQVKECDSQDHHRPSAGEASYIEGPTPTNSFGFKISQPNIQVAKSVRQVQFLTLLSVELHVRTRKTLCPDPEFDPICAIFYHIEHETTQGKKYETGIIVVRNESTKLRSCDTSSVSTANTSTSMPAPHHGTSNKTSYEDSLLRHAGISNELNILTEHQETDAINRFIKLVHDWDPDILLGFEVQMLSWGYLIQRASALGIDLAPQLSRVQDSSGTARFNAEKDQWGANHTSEISITGRIVLNVWRLMRHEVTLNVYSFENISYHVLHERIPLYTYRQLTRWWDHKLPHDRWRTVEHYIIRCQGNIKILNHVDFINRTSEFARLFGILFYSVISRGSQFRVESMMLRLAKPMNYLAVSPSIQQRARMDAPECIPLVMEPESRFYSDPVIVLDFQSLYPSMMIAYNYCFSTCLGKVSRLDKIGNFDFGCTSLNVPPALLEKLEDDIHISANGSAFVKPNIRKGILPRMVEEILDTRVMVKKAMKEHKNDKILGQLLDARQLGLKLIANVTYGYTSANFSGRMPCVEIADAIVRKARETLERAIHLVNSKKEWGARVVYGDTDSLFVLVKGATKEEAFQIGKEIVDAVTAENPKPVKLKFEKVYLPCVLQTKKRYVGYMYETLEQKEPVFDAKGIETVRRDTCPAVAKILEKSLRILFEEKDISLVKKFVQRQLRKLMEERVSLQDFIFAKEYRGMKGYKPTACVPALELARRQLSRDRRAEPRVGERVPYVVVNGSPGLPLIQLVRSPGDVLDDASLRLNSSYYINKQIIPPLNRVFSLIGIDVFTWYTELPRYVPRHHVNTGKQKSSISRFFTTLHCPVCEQLTQQGLCRGCRDNPQKAVVILAERVGNWERKYNHLTEMCFQCCGTRDAAMTCISLDCPVMFKRIKMTRNLEYGETLRDVQKGIQVTNR